MLIKEVKQSRKRIDTINESISSLTNEKDTLASKLSQLQKVYDDAVISSEQQNSRHLKEIESLRASYDGNSDAFNFIKY